MDIGRYFLIIVIVLIPLVIWLLRKVYRFEKVRFVRRRAAAQAVRDASNADPQLVRKRIALSVIVVILCVVSYVVVRYGPRDFTPSMAAITGGLVFIGPLLVILLVFIYKGIVGMGRDHNLDDDTHSSDDIFS